MADEFIIEHTLHQLQKQIDLNRTERIDYQSANDDKHQVTDDRVEALEESESEINGTLNSLRNELSNLSDMLTSTIGELNKTKLINIKQDLMIRTLHDLSFFEGYDMYADTFADGSNIDWENSIRAEFMEDFQAVGKSRQSTVIISQVSSPSFSLISKNGSSDEAYTQSFLIDKTRELDKISVQLRVYDEQTYQPVYVSILESLTSTPLTQVTLFPDDIKEGWMDLDIPNVFLQGGKEYYIDIRTNDIYGYTVGVDTMDLYLPGTSYSLFNGVHTDNNYDIAFKIWCYPAEDENDAFIYTLPKLLESMPETIIFETEETVIEGGINYYISRDGGVNWKILQAGIQTNLNDLPEGNTLVLQAHVMGDSRVNAWGYVVTRSDN